MKNRISMLVLVTGLGIAPFALSHLDSTAFYLS